MRLVGAITVVLTSLDPDIVERRETDKELWFLLGEIDSSSEAWINKNNDKRKNNFFMIVPSKKEPALASSHILTP